MQVSNVHSRDLAIDADRLGALLDTLSSENDGLWPRENWPSMQFDRPLGIGAIDGHGPIRYTVQDYRRGRFIRFQFTAPHGFDGYHEFRVEACNGGARLQHELVMRTRGLATLSWLLAFRPLHDALIEDALDKAEAVTTGRLDRAATWSLHVHVLRNLMKRLPLGLKQEGASLPRA
jgi:hypothetical protein